MQLFIIFAIFILIVEGNGSELSAARSTVTKPLYLLTLVPFPDPSEGAGWDRGLETISGARVARDEINNCTDLLPDHHIELIVENIEACSRTDVGTGLTNLVRHTINPQRRPVTALIGLFCSTHTAFLSEVAGHEGFNMLQLTAANSLIFEKNHNQYPHLWRFLGSSNIYANVILELMDRFKWNRVGIVYDAGSEYYTINALYIWQKIKESDGKSVDMLSSVLEKQTIYFESAIQEIKRNQITILIVLLNEQQANVLLSKTFAQDLIYPNYTWIHIQVTLSLLINEGSNNEDLIYRAKLGHFHLHTQITQSHELFYIFQRNYENDLKLFNTSTKIDDTDSIYASYLYDQVWAFALAMNHSLPVLEKRNLSIDNYTIGQPEITQVLEEQLASLNFEGASGQIRFDNQRGVFTPVEIFRVNANKTETLIGIYNPNGSLSFVFHEDINDIPNDRLDVPTVDLLIPFGLAVTLYIIAVAVSVFTTIQLLFFLYYRNEKEIKATSPYLSLFMFAASYFLTCASIFKITYGSFIISEQAFITMVVLNHLLVTNGVSFFFISLFIKLLRLHYIFSSWKKHDLGKFWHTCPLIIFILCFSILPNIATITQLLINHPKRNITVLYNTATETFQKHIIVESIGNYSFLGLAVVYIITFLALIVFVVYRNRNIEMKLFNDAKVYLYLVIGTITLSMMLTLYFILLLNRKEVEANVVITICMLTQCVATQSILFSPIITHVVAQKHFSGVCLLR